MPSDTVTLTVERSTAEEIYESSKKVFDNPLFEPQITPAQRDLRRALEEALDE